MKSKEFAVAGAMISLVMYVLALSLTSQVLSALQTSRTVTNSGTVKAVGVGVYSELACVNPVTLIDWGTLEPGQTINKTVYIKNTSNVPVTLSMNTQNWSPSNTSNYITCTWDSAGKSLNVNQVISAVLTLSVKNTIAGIANFSFDMVIVGSG